MDSLPALGTSILDNVQQTQTLYGTLLKANEKAIRSTSVKTFVYGPNPRHELDVYYPSKQSSAQSPILIFVYGGGLIRGGKTIPLGDGLAYANIAHFFAEKFGFTTVIPDYRLMSHNAKFPSGGEDVQLAVEWVLKELVSPSQQRPLFLMGNSAGGVHITTFLLFSNFIPTIKKITEDAPQSGLRLSGVVELSVPFEFSQTNPRRAETLQAYFGDIEKNSPLGLVEQTQPRFSHVKDVPFLVATNEHDPPDEIIHGTKKFMDAWAGEKPETLQIEGHNHISSVLALGLGIDREEKWGNDVGKWLQSKI